MVGPGINIQEDPGAGRPFPGPGMDDPDLENGPVEPIMGHQLKCLVLGHGEVLFLVLLYTGEQAELKVIRLGLMFGLLLGLSQAVLKSYDEGLITRLHHARFA